MRAADAVKSRVQWPSVRRELEEQGRELQERREIMAAEDRDLAKMHAHEDAAFEKQPAEPLTGTIDSLFKSKGEKWSGGDSAEAIHLGYTWRGERKAFIVADITGGRGKDKGRLKDLHMNQFRWGNITGGRIFSYDSKYHDRPDSDYIHTLMGAINHHYAFHAPENIFCATTVGVLNSHTRNFSFSVAGNPSPIIYNVTKGRFVRKHYFEPTGMFLGINAIDTINPDKTVNYEGLEQFAKDNPISHAKFDPNDRYEVFMFTDGLCEAERKRPDGSSHTQFHMLVGSDVGTAQAPDVTPITPLEKIIHDHFRDVKAGHAEDSHLALAKKVYRSFENDFHADERENRLQMVTVLPLAAYRDQLPGFGKKVHVLLKSGFPRLYKAYRSVRRVWRAGLERAKSKLKKSV